MAQVMKVEPLSERRHDKASRTLKVTGAPVLEYSYDRYRYRKGVESHTVRWLPDEVELCWHNGTLISVRVRGHKLKKDGTAGQLTDAERWSVTNGKLVALHSRDYPTEWLQKILDLYSEVPRHARNEDEYSWPSAVGPHDVLRAD
jgi:hypothetical protein